MGFFIHWNFDHGSIRCQDHKYFCWSMAITVTLWAVLEMHFFLTVRLYSSFEPAASDCKHHLMRFLKWCIDGTVAHKWNLTEPQGSGCVYWIRWDGQPSYNLPGSLLCSTDGSDFPDFKKEEQNLLFFRFLCIFTDSHL